MKQRILIWATLAIISTLPLQAQDEPSAPFSRLNVALRVATTGIGLEAATPLSNHFNARLGVDYFGYKSRYYDILIKDKQNDLYDAFGYVPDYHAKGTLGLLHGRLLADYHPGGGIFHLTAGVYVGNFNANVNGYLADRDNVNQPAKLKDGYEWPSIDFDGQKIDLTNGYADLDLTLGNAVKPYIGLGLGRAVTRRNVGFKVELGVLYLGDYTLRQNGKKLNISGGSADVSEVADVHEYLQALQWYPMLSFQLSYRLF